jgi:hypothetical protein
MAEKTIDLHAPVHLDPADFVDKFGEDGRKGFPVERIVFLVL